MKLGKKYKINIKRNLIREKKNKNQPFLQDFLFYPIDWRCCSLSFLELRQLERLFSDYLQFILVRKYLFSIYIIIIREKGEKFTFHCFNCL